MTELPWRPYVTESVRRAPCAYGFVSTRATSQLQLDSRTQIVLVAGAFDGLHLGHRALIDEARAVAIHRRLPCVALTFDPDPAQTLEGTQPSTRLLSTADRVSGLLELGVDAVITVSFTAELARRDAESFVRDVLCSLASPAVICVGSNFRFGHLGAGDVHTLAQLGATYGFEVRVRHLLSAEGDTVSSTRIRALLSSGKLSSANGLLGRCHYVRGVVAHGRGEGTAFGFPTANVECDVVDCLPQEGVYACYVVYGSKAWPAATNVGAPPTFSSPRPAFMEANLIGFSGNLYGREVAVVFVAWLRASRPFDSLEELERVVLSNIDWVRANLGDHALEVGG